MSGELWNIALGLAFAAAAAGVAWRVGALTFSGALAALLLGTVVFGMGGLGWAFVLFGFFISSSVLSRLFKGQKARLEENFSKGSRRDAAQVAANGGIAGLFVLLHALFPEAAWPWAGFAGALAAANADTWATELGVLSRSAPRLITTGRAVERGASGAVSALGLLAAFSGAAVIGLLAAIIWQGRVAALPGDAPVWAARALGSAIPTLPLPQAAAFGLWVTLAGLSGSLLDSWLGATVQAIYYCPACRKETERHPLHSCGTPTRLMRGWRRMDNDWVNTLCTLAGAMIAVLLAL